MRWGKISECLNKYMECNNKGICNKTMAHYFLIFEENLKCINALAGPLKPIRFDNEIYIFADKISYTFSYTNSYSETNVFFK